MKIRHGACGMCGGDLHPLGRLGDREHYVCRQCGGQFSRQAKAKKAKESKQEA